MKLSIIIVNYKSRAYLEKCLASVFAKINIAFEVIVVNNSLEEELDFVATSFPGVKIIQNTQNSGFGSANNLGAKEAQGEVLFFLNPDAEILSSNILAVMAEFENDKTLGILGSKLVSVEGTVQKWIAGGEVSLWNILRNNAKIIWDKKYWQSCRKVAVSWVAGTALFIRKKLFVQLGGFDEHFFMYFEDTDLCKRAGNLGKKVFYYPAFSVLHHGGKSFSEKRSQKKGYYLSQDYYFRKHRGFFEGLLLKMFRFFSI